MNDIETIDGIKGEWRTVTKPEEVKVGQRVRYDGKGCRFGYTDNKNNFNRIRIITADGGGDGGVSIEHVFSFLWDGKPQAFFPLPAKPKRKVAKVTIFHKVNGWNWIIYSLAGSNASSIRGVKSRKSALRGARRFCKAIGYEMEVVK